MSLPIRTTRVLAALLVGVGLAGCGDGSPPASSERLTAPPASASSEPSPTAPPSAPSPSSEADLLGAWTVATLELGGGPDMPTDAFGSLWLIAVDGELMNDGTEPAVHRIDPATNEVIASIPLPGRLCQGIGASPEAIWACGPDGLSRIDPETNTIVATIALDAALAISRIAYGAGSVWAFATATVGPDLVVRVDPATDEVTDTIELGHPGGTMTFAFDALWVTSPPDGALLRIDPATNDVAIWTEGLETPGIVAAGADALWVSLYGEHGFQAAADEPSVVRIDPATGDVLASIVTGGSLGDEGGIAATGDAVWIRAPEPWLVLVDPETNEILETIDTVSGPGDVRVAFDSVWVTTERGDLIRLDP